MKNEKTAADRYREHLKDREAEIVDVTVPSGFVFKFRKPSKFSMLFAMGTLPLTAVSAAVTKWKDDGIVKSDDTGDDEADNLKLAEMVFKARDRVLELSVEPKLVMGLAGEGEISAQDVPDEDMAFLFNWVMAGGESSAMLGTFPAGSQPSPLASAGGKNRRNPRK